MLPLKPISLGQYSLYAICRETEGPKEPLAEEVVCPLEDFLSDRKSLGKDKDRMIRRLKEIAKRGPYYLPDMSHRIEGEVRQTEQGRVCVLWFSDGEKIIYTHGFIKKTPKTPQKEKERAKRALKAYFGAKEDGILVYLEEDEEE